MGGQVESIGEIRNTYNILVRKSDGNISSGRHRRIWRIILKKNLEKEGVDWFV
jgi:hypothetical protein